ncbi:unnamed protein product [Malus baccata var. baccata]
MKRGILFSSFFLLFSASSAFNITKLLEKQSDFSNFNNLLSETKLADEINRRSTITILAVDNGAAGGLSGKSSDLTKKILSVHVVLDYYDTDKLKKIFKSNKSATLTTLFQSTGEARKEQGFITVSVKDNQISFGSAAKGNNGDNHVSLVKSVISQPYNISVLQVGSIIDVPDIENSGSAPAHSPKSAKAPSPSKSKKEGDDGAPSPSDDDESSSDKASAPSKKNHDKDSASAPTPSSPAPSAASRTRGIVAVGAAVLIMMGEAIVPLFEEGHCSLNWCKGKIMEVSFLFQDHDVSHKRPTEQNLFGIVQGGLAANSAHLSHNSMVLPENISVKRNSCLPSTQVAKRCSLTDETSKRRGNPTDQRTLKFRIKMNPDNTARKNVAIYSGLGLGSPSSSLENSPEESKEMIPPSQVIVNDSPTNIIQAS